MMDGRDDVGMEGEDNVIVEEEEECLEEAKRLMVKKVIIPDRLVESVLKVSNVNLSDVESREKWLGQEKLNGKGMPYPKSANEVKESPSNFPPYYYDGKTTSPVNLSNYLFAEYQVHEGCPLIIVAGGERALVEKEVYAKGRTNKNDAEHVANRNRFPLRRERYKLLLKELTDRFKEDVELDLGVARYDEKKGKMEYENEERRAGTGSRLQAGRTVMLVCKRCMDREKGEFSPVVRLKVYEKEKEGMMEYGLLALEVYFHNVDCCRDRKNRSSDWYIGVNGGEKRCGWLKFGSTEGGVKLEELRKMAFDQWIAYLNTFKDPEKHLPGEGGKSENILFGAEEKKRNDNRRQVRIEEAGSLPSQIDRKAYMSFTAWWMFKMVCKLNLCEEWTPFIPLRRPKRCGGKPFGRGEYPIEARPEETRIPTHLFMKGGFLLFGGMQLEKGNKKKARKLAKEAYCDQEAHKDFFNEKFTAASECPLLEGLHAPLTFNVALEDERSIWVMNNWKGAPVAVVDGNERRINVPILKNEALVIGCDTVHGGKAWVFEPDDGKTVNWKPKYRPSFRAVISSTRYPTTEGYVNMAIGRDTYIPPEHQWHLDDEAFEAEFLKEHQVMKDLVANGKIRRNLSSNVKDALAICEEAVKTVDNIMSGKRRKKRAGRKRRKKEGQGERK
jgi:hypothetical protein